MLIIGSGVILTMMMNNHTDCGVSHPRMMVPAGPRRRASRRQSFALPTRDSDLSKRRRQSERLRKLNRSSARTCWRLLLGVAACCEFISYLYPVSIESNDEEDDSPRWHFFGFANEKEELTLESAVVSMETPALTVMYLLYLVDAFVQANSMRRKSVRENEKERLLGGGKLKRHPWSPLVVCAITLLLYVSILPTWFLWEIKSLLWKDPFITTPVIQESAVENVQYSMAYAILVHLYRNLSTSLQETLEEQGAILERTIKRRLTRFAIFHPRTFLRRYRKVQLAIIWIKYLAPIGAHVMNSNFVGVMVDVLKQWRQGAQEQYQYLRRRSKWMRLNDEARKEVAAVIIQRNFRSYQSRKWMRLVKRQVEKREEEIIMLVQNAIRKRYKVEIEQDECALKELELLQQQAEQEQHSKWNRVSSVEGLLNLSALVGPTPLDDEETRKQKYRLREEVQRKIDSEKQKLMLLRPDSTFVLHYQLLYILCAIIETTHLVLQPWLKEEEQHKTWFVDTVRHFSRYGHTLVSLVLGLGILIKFFVGEFDNVTGRLLPQSFFSRWIYPGILLHLIVNPSLKEISDIVKRVVLFMLRAGPGRVWRWWILLFLPIWRRILLWWEWKIWMRLVQRKNQSLTEQRPQQRHSASLIFIKSVPHVQLLQRIQHAKQ